MHLLSTASSPAEIADLAGGKARNLFRLDGVDPGVRIPRWCVLGTDVFAHVVDGSGLGEEITERLGDATDDALPGLAAEVRERIMEVTLDDDVQAVLRAAFDHVGPGPLAVRSSAVREDGSDYSYAGQFESSLGVRGYDEMVRTVLRCWSSVYAEAPVRHRARNGLGPRDAMAVIVQQLVPADRSGVLFTANPMSGRRDEMVISAAYGLGEGVVSGSVDPDTVVVAGSTGEVLDYHVGEKETRVDGDEGRSGSVAHPVPETARGQRVLRSSEIDRLRDVGRRIEDVFDGAQDIEWAMAGSELWILQARPAVLPGPPPHPPGDTELLWDNSNIIESYGDLTSPLTFTFARHVYHRVYAEYCRLLHVPRAQQREMDEWLPNLLGYFNGRVYYNLLNWYKIVRLLPLYSVNRRIFELSLGVQESLDDASSDATRPFAIRGVRSRLASARVKAAFVRRTLGSGRSVRSFIRDFDAVFDDFDQVDYDSLPADEVYRRFLDLERDLLGRWAPMIVLEATIITSLGLLFGATHHWIPDPPSWFYWSVADPGGDVVSAKPARELSRLAGSARAEPDVARIVLESAVPDIRAALEAGGHRTFLREVDSYVRHYGYRSVNELKLEEPDLTQDPSSLFVMLRSALRSAPDEPRPDRTDEVHRIVRQHLGPGRRLIYGLLRRRARQALADRERVRFCRTKGFGIARRMFLAMGRDLARMGALPSERDVFGLRLDELRGCFDGTIDHDDLRVLVELRAARGENRRDLSPPARFRTRGAVYWCGNLDPERWSPAADADGSGPLTLRGVPSAPGVAEGVATVATTPDEGTDQILVTYRTDPGWIGLLPSVKALVIERGSPLTHVAIVARELGIPTVVQVPGVTRAVRTGTRLRVDGGTGELTVLTTDTEVTS